MEDLTGREFGSYRVVAAVRQGGMAAVYKAYQLAVERHVALKILSRQFTADPQFLRRFQHEAKIVAQFQHPHIMPVFDFGESDGHAFLAMPFVNGGTLGELVKKEHLSLSAIVRIVGQICEALDYAHQKGVVHRDVKPSNILMLDRQNCLVADFGLARISAETTQLTITGAVMGTPAYMSPEQASGQTAETTSDVYSLGVVLYELLTGRVPFVADTPVAVMMGHLTATIPPPRHIKPELSPALEAVVLKALARQPGDRFASAMELQASLVSAAYGRQAVHHVPAEPGSSAISAIAESGDSKTIASDKLPVVDASAALRSRRKSYLVRATGAFLLALSIISMWLWRVEHPATRMTSEPSVRPGAGDSDVGATEGGTSALRAETTPPTDKVAATPANDSSPSTDKATEATIAAVVPPPQDKASSRSKQSHIVVDAPSGTQIYVDDVFRGIANGAGQLTIDVEPAGTHNLRLSSPGKRDFEQKVSLGENQTVTVHGKLDDVTGKLQITAKSGAEVLVDRSSRGIVATNGTLVISNLGAGSHDVQVLAPGMKPFHQIINVSANQEVAVEATLESSESSPVSEPKRPDSPPLATGQFSLFHFASSASGARWHFGILTISRGRIEWSETPPFKSLRSLENLLDPRFLDSNVTTDNFAVGCPDVLDIGPNLSVVGEHVQLTNQTYNFAQGIKTQEGKLEPVNELQIPGLDKAAATACPRSVK